MAVNQSMKRSQSVDAFLAGRLAQVDIRKIENELTRLWTKAADSSTGEAYPQVVRACSANLVLYTDRQDALNADANLLDEIVHAHPSRAILAICRPAEQRNLSAWVTARCHLASGPETKQVCSEQITVLAEGDLELELASVVESLLLGDLPVLLWWSVDDLSGDKLGPFLACTRRLIVDSGRSPYSFAFLRDLHRIVDSTSGCIAASDLNWRRLLGIRSAIAEEFERAPFSVADLNNIVRVKISACGQDRQSNECSLQSLLLLGWLAGRLDLLPVAFARDSKRGTHATFEKDEQIIEVEFSSVEMTHIRPGAVFEIELEVAGKKTLVVSRDPSGQAGTIVITVRVNGEICREAIVDDSDLDLVHMLGLELDEMSPDPVFEQSLAGAFALLRLLEEN